MSQGESDQPSEETLTEPVAGVAGDWRVIARTKRVNSDWEKLMNRAPGAALRWYTYLRKSPTTRYPGRVFPLRGSLYTGAWECEITGGDRVFYIPDETSRKVMVYYAGPHCSPAPAVRNALRTTSAASDLKGEKRGEDNMVSPCAIREVFESGM